MRNIRLEFSTIKIPETCPEEWPFDDWISPIEWEKAHSSLAWVGFWYVDTLLEGYIKNKKNLFKEAILGFSNYPSSLARVTSRGDIIFISLDWRIQQKALIAASSNQEKLAASLLAINDTSLLNEMYYRVIMELSKEELKTRIRVAGLIIHFLVEHELSHARLGHFQIAKNNTRDKNLIRAMEFAADTSATSSVLIILLRPIIEDDVCADELESIPRIFGYALTVFLLAKAPHFSANSKYPTFYERITIIFGKCLVSCRKSENWAKAALGLVKANCMAGMREALSEIIREKIIPLPAAYISLGEHIAPQRANCVSCSTFARSLASQALSAIDEVRSFSGEFSKNNQSMWGFNILDYNLEKIKPHTFSYCPMDHPVRHRLESIVKFFQKSK